ncbi:MAG TPA: hypothetical protein VEG30_11950 [Terriglobales bacterium]|nr:hypothetical protein [Terriglobales bacterium]
MKRSFLLQAVATGSLWIGLLLPVLIVALRWNHQRLDKRLLLFFTLIYLDLICALAPRVGNAQEASGRASWCTMSSTACPWSQAS